MLIALTESVVLPTLSTGRKRAPSFSPGDVLAMAILYRITENCVPRIGQLTRLATGIFNICDQTSWDFLADCIRVLDLSKHDCLIVAKSNDISVNDAVVICPFGLLIAGLQNNLQKSSWSSAQKTPPLASAFGRSREAWERP